MKRSWKSHCGCCEEEENGPIVKTEPGFEENSGATEKHGKSFPGFINQPDNK
jgi:hypothetical protein